MHKSSTIYKWKQSKNVCGFWCERTTGWTFHYGFWCDSWKLKHLNEGFDRQLVLHKVLIDCLEVMWSTSELLWCFFYQLFGLLRTLYTESDIFVYAFFFIFVILSYQNACYGCKNAENWNWSNFFFFTTDESFRGFRGKRVWHNVWLYLFFNEWKFRTRISDSVCKDLHSDGTHSMQSDVKLNFTKSVPIKINSSTYWMIWG